MRKGWDGERDYQPLTDGPGIVGGEDFTTASREAGKNLMERGKKQRQVFICFMEDFILQGGRSSWPDAQRRWSMVYVPMGESPGTFQGRIHELLGEAANWNYDTALLQYDGEKTGNRTPIIPTDLGWNYWASIKAGER